MSSFAAHVGVFMSHSNYDSKCPIAIFRGQKPESEIGEFSTLWKKCGIKFGLLEIWSKIHCYRHRNRYQGKGKKTASVVEKLMKVHLLMFQAQLQ